MKVFLKLKWFFKQEKRAYGIGVSFLVIVAFLQLIPPRIIGIIVDAIESNTLTKELLIYWLVILISTGVIMYILRYFWRLKIFGSSIKLARQLRKQLYDHYTKMSQSFYQKYRTGDLMAHATNDLQIIQQTAGSGVLTFVDALTVGGFVIIAMAITISWKLTLIVLLPMPIMAILTHLYGRQLHYRFRQAQEAFSSLNDKTQESVTGIKVIKTFGQEQEEINSFSEMSKDVVNKNIRVAQIDALYDPTISIIVGISFFLSIAFGAKYVIAEELTIGQLVTFTTYLGLLIWPMLAFGHFFNIVERGRASYERITNLLNEPVDIVDREDSLNVIPKGDITFNIDSFIYPDETEPVLENINFKIKKGTTVGIVGKTGVGKTTLLKLFLREFDNYNGEILIGQQKINCFKLTKLREAVGYVPQDNFLFSTTIKENIAFAKVEATDEEIIKAAKIANVHEDIIQFPQQYNTVVGERGVSLSGGQQQRLAIARAVLLDPEILILDDSLSAVDANTEEAILKSLKEERHNKTTIITTHRLSAIEAADLIIVIDEGTITESGTHDELMSLKGWYKQMYLRQQLEQQVEKGG